MLQHIEVVSFPHLFVYFTFLFLSFYCFYIVIAGDVDASVTLCFVIPKWFCVHTINGENSDDKTEVHSNGDKLKSNANTDKCVSVIKH